MTRQQAIQNQWTIAYHRMKFAEAAKKDGKNPDCKCEDCREHFAALATQGEQQ